MSLVSLLLFFAFASPRSAVLLTAALPAVEARVALEAKYLAGRCVAFAAMLILLPLLLALAAAVRATSRGPVLFRQQRVGEAGELFEMLKFRSMRLADEASVGFIPVGAVAPGGVEGLDRRTSIGRLIRRTSLDELPQLWNVVRGDMCLVGPRPARPEHLARF